jgi:hypothetical protein
MIFYRFYPSQEASPGVHDWSHEGGEVEKGQSTGLFQTPPRGVEGSERPQVDTHSPKLEGPIEANGLIRAGEIFKKEIGANRTQAEVHDIGANGFPGDQVS